MKYFISYRHTGETVEKLDGLLIPIRNAFEKKGDEVYCTYFNEDSFRERGLMPHDIMHEAFRKIEDMGAMFVILDSEQKSEGMIMEVGYCIAKKIPVVIAARKGLENTYLPSMADTLLEYDTIDELIEKISTL